MFAITRLAAPLAVAALATVGCSAGGSSTSAIDRGTGATGAGAETGTGTGNSGNSGGSLSLGLGGAASSDPTCGSVLPVTYRDFKPMNEPGGHPDFELSARGIYDMSGNLYKGWNDVGCGMVLDQIGTDSKPQFYGGPIVTNGATFPPVGGNIGKLHRTVTGPGCYTAQNTNPTGICYVGTCDPWTFMPPTYDITSATTFNQWYNTTAGVNEEIPGMLTLTETPVGSGVYVYDTTAFFPIDGMGFGNSQGQSHNYSFTTEIHVLFEYQAKQVFTFRGDDDLWIFVNGKLALDEGGAHQALQGSIDFDSLASTLGISVGGTYQMDIFQAERQTTESNFRIETNIRCFQPVTVK